jgi:autotransporter-associated beta strand protein
MCQKETSEHAVVESSLSKSGHIRKSFSMLVHLLPLLLLLVLIAVWCDIAAAISLRSVGSFDIRFYNSGESDGTATGTQNWTTQQMDDVAASVSTWTNRLTNTPGRQVNLHLFWNYYGDGTLAGSLNPSNGNGSTSWTYTEHVWRDGVNYSGPWTGFDARIRFDTSTSWNFGSGLPGSGQYDFRSVATHEIGHLVGFHPTFDDYDSTWGNCGGTSTSPSAWAGYYGVSRWDQNLRDDAGNRPNNNGTGTPYSTNFQDDPMWFVGSHAVAYNGGNVPIYAPYSYESGSSLCHLDQNYFLDPLVMSPFIDDADAIRTPVGVKWEILKDLGWVVLKSWNKGAGTLTWGSANNWDYSGIPDDMNQVQFANTGLNGGDTVDLGGNKAVNSLKFDTATSFTIGGSSGTLTILSGSLVRTAASSGTQTIARPVALGANAVWNVAGSGELDMTSAISGNYSFEKRGTGTLTLSGGNSYTGATIITQGIIKLAANNSLPSATTLSLSPQSSTSQLDLAGFNQTIGSLNITLPYSSGTQQVIINSSGSGTLTLGGNVTVTGGGNDYPAIISANINLGASTRTFNVPNNNNSLGDLQCAGSISGASGLTKSGSGILSYSGTTANSYSGLSTINVGTLLLAKSGSANAIANGGLTIGDGTNAATVRYTGASTDMMGTGTVTLNRRGILDFNGKTDIIGNVAISSNSTYAGQISNTAGGGALTIGTLAFTGGGAVATSTGKIVLGGNVTYSTGTSGIAATLTGKIDLNATRTFSIANDASLPSEMIVSAVIANGIGTNGITKTGAGTLTFNASNTYSGNTTVNGGSLEIAGGISSSGTSLIDVQSGMAMLKTVSVSKTNLNISTAALATFEVVNGTNTVGAISGSGITKVDAGASLTAASIKQGTLTFGSGATLTIQAIPSGHQGGVITPVPEPSAFAILAGSLIMAIYAWARKQKTQ